MITLKYFASLKAIAEKEEERLDIENPITIDQLSDIISKTAPKMGIMIREKKVLISVNQEMASVETIIYDGDEVAFLPPFSGGTK
ncbi:MAG: MoaD/ThiS family protein [Nitrospina sp.]|jgi:molybdopterin converting factor subunit 1|nr:MoaD/ThiS family protein [Nitrospina sp.]MBT3510491.1 MoaD/ThiS family protein [Nitrospina sp.]MBT3875748.1 MoaD/ThiS family protein [Nitrospina sp.]MBT4049195.1 MoaD/ThiS family protein [Nitrospina sp.]MBT4557164.1 MoaD/ThiS family protein [Nitrospina sp.]